MPRFAQFDHTVAAPAPVTGWYDTDALVYGNLPQSADLLAVTATQWAAHMANPSGWAVNAGALVAFTAPAPALSLVQLAVAALFAGVAVSSTSTPALNGTYSMDPAAQGRMAGVSTYILVNGRFPGGVSSYSWTDSSRAPHVFSSTAVAQAFFSAIADRASVLEQIIANGAGTLPTAGVSIA